MAGVNKYPISDDIILLLDKAEAAKKIRDLAVKLPFGYKKAHRAAVDEIRFRRSFWEKVIDVYPELRGRQVSFYPEGKYVAKTEDNKGHVI